MPENQVPVRKMSGYSPGKELAGQRITRNGRSVFIVSLPIDLLPIHLPIPDPDQPFEHNRRVSAKRARDFGQYWADNPDSWTIPPLLIDTPGSLKFDLDVPVDRGADWGQVTLPNNSSQFLRILDGQHRILGWKLKLDELTKQQSTFVQRRANARRDGDRDAEARAGEGLERVERLLKRMQDEQVTMEILTQVSDSEHMTFFVTVADFAKSVNRSERHRLDEFHLDSIVARELSDDLPLLYGRIEEHMLSARKQSDDLMSLANLCDVVRHLTVGINGRISAARQHTLKPDEISQVARLFFDGLMQAVPAFKRISENQFSPADLRKQSLFGSVTVLRCLAGAYFEIAVRSGESSLAVDEESHRKFMSFVQDLAPYMAIKDKRLVHNTEWVATRFVNDGELAPRSRSQDLKGLTALFVKWVHGRPFQPASL